ESYQQWRRRLADRQDDLRHLGEPETEPALSSEWAPEALVITGGGSSAADDGSVDLTVPSEESAPAEPELLGPIVAAGSDPVTDDGWDRSEVDALLRQFRATV